MFWGKSDSPPSVINILGEAPVCDLNTVASASVVLNNNPLFCAELCPWGRQETLADDNSSLGSQQSPVNNVVVVGELVSEEDEEKKEEKDERPKQQKQTVLIVDGASENVVQRMEEYQKQAARMHEEGMQLMAAGVRSFVGIVVLDSSNTPAEIPGSRHGIYSRYAHCSIGG